MNRIHRLKNTPFFWAGLDPEGTWFSIQAVKLLLLGTDKLFSTVTISHHFYAMVCTYGHCNCWSCASSDGSVKRLILLQYKGQRHDLNCWVTFSDFLSNQMHLQSVKWVIYSPRWRRTSVKNAFVSTSTTTIRTFILIPLVQAGSECECDEAVWAF